MSSLRSRHDDWEGCSSPLPNPPRRPTTASDHGEGRRHDHRKPKDGLQEGTRTDGDHGEGQRQPTQKKPAGERARTTPLRLFASKPRQRRQSATEGPRGLFPPSPGQKGARMPSWRRTTKTPPPEAGWGGSRGGGTSAPPRVVERRPV